MVSAELGSSSLESKPEAAGEADELSLSLILPPSPGVAASWLMAMRTEAASSS